MQERLRSLSSTNRKWKQRVTQTRNKSTNNTANDKKYEREIKKLKEERKLLERSKKQQEKSPTDANTYHISANLKNEDMVFVNHGGQQENIELITVIIFIEQTLNPLSNYEKCLKTQLTSIWPSRLSN